MALGLLSFVFAMHFRSEREQDLSASERLPDSVTPLAEEPLIICVKRSLWNRRSQHKAKHVMGSNLHHNHHFVLFNFNTCSSRCNTVMPEQQIITKPWVKVYNDTAQVAYYAHIEILCQWNLLNGFNVKLGQENYNLKQRIKSQHYNIPLI